MYDRLYDNLCKILDEMDQKEKLNTSDVQIIDWVAHAKKSLKAVEQMEDGEYSGNYAGDDYSRDYSREYSRDGGRSSYARGRNAKRDSMGRYSRESRDYSRGNDMAERIRDMMEEAPDSATRQELKRLASKLESM